MSGLQKNAFTLAAKDKDIFRTIMNNQDLIPILLDDKLLVEHKTAYDQFSQYWFSDILHRS
jgi:hypothetical protein